MLEVPKVALNISVELKSLAGFEVDVEGGVHLRAFVELTEDPHLDRQTPILAKHHLLEIHEENLNRKEVMVREATIDRQGILGSHGGVFGLRIVLLLIDEATGFASADF